MFVNVLDNLLNILNLDFDAKIFEWIFFFKNTKYPIYLQCFFH